MESRRLQRCFPEETSTVCLLLYQFTDRLLLLNDGDYTRANEESQESDLHRICPSFGYNSTQDASELADSSSMAQNRRTANFC